MQGTLTTVSRGALGLALLLLAPAAGALTLGEIDLRSALGEALDARIPLTLADGQTVDAGCFTLLRDEGDRSAPVLAEGILTVERPGGAPVLRIRSTARIFEPAIAVHVRSSCPAGASPAPERRYALLLDPRPGAPSVVSVPAIAATLSSAPGDTLESFAQRVFPTERAARQQYLAALREANPAFASQGDREALPEGSPIALPDLRTYGRTRATAPARTATTVAAREAPREAPAPRPPRITAPAKADAAPRMQAPTREAQPRTPPVTTKAAAAPEPKRAEPRRAASGPAFELRLSSSEVDMTRTRGIDDRMRSHLRERLLVLDADDHVAALLSLRNNLKQLESRVAELQLKIASMPPSLASRPEAVAPTQPEPPKAEAPKTELAKLEPPKPEAAKVEPPKAEPTATPVPAVPKAVGAPPPKALPALPVTDEWIAGVDNTGVLVVGAVALLLLGAAALALRRRRGVVEDEKPSVAPGSGNERMPAEPAFDSHSWLIAADARPPRPTLASDAGLSTRLPENSRELRRRYIEERFPEIANRTLVLDDPSSVVKAARLFYEDGALPRAVELLQFCIEDNPQEVRTWLALFEIFRLERLTGEFAELARRFYEHHGNSEYRRKVRYFGREIDPANILYQEDTISALETIGPAGAHAMGATAAAFDPIAENWLDAPMDFENQVLANELRKALMTEAGLTEGDLIPNPMPALRNIEMFTVA